MPEVAYAELAQSYMHQARIDLRCGTVRSLTFIELTDGLGRIVVTR